ncbi:MAG TPA: hypothetical protein VGC34_09945 [Steroidobacteraceae bacterium]
MTGILALTLWQPWATLVAEGAKPYEFRHWATPRAYCGRRIAIHAGARKVVRKEILELLVRLNSEAWRTTGLNRDIAIPILEAVAARPKCDNMLLSCIVCTVTLGEPIRDEDLERSLGFAPADSDREEHTNWGWPMLDVRRVEPPVPYKGAQGFWLCEIPADFISPKEQEAV